MKDSSTDVLIIGSGGAGLSLALQLAEFARVIVLSKGELAAGATQYAQGGIAAVLSAQDSVRSHVKDTLIAGDGLCDESVVAYTAARGAAAIDWLANLGVAFTREEAQFHLTREGGHSHRRIIHADDATGRAVQTTLTERVLTHPNITVVENQLAVNLIKQQGRVMGAYVYDEASDRIHRFAATFTVLATGGASRVYLYSTTPEVASGDGIAMAWRAGCRVANLEFNQFHPTCLYHERARSLLLTEAIRGEGGYLLRPDGSRFMPDFDTRAELAPRDIVARAIDFEMKRLGADCMYLDISHKSPAFISDRFPNLCTTVARYGFDMTRGPLPVVPAAHYTCGGVMTNLSGATDVPGLYAIGETAFTGLHGANRMASNSLVECIVFAQSAAESIKNKLPHWPKPISIAPWDDSRVSRMQEAVLVTHTWDELRRCMWDYVGIVRSNERLARAQSRIHLLKGEIEKIYAHYRLDRNLIEMRNLLQVAELIVESALSRKESRGLHYNIDYPKKIRFAENTVLKPAIQAGRSRPVSLEVL